MTCSRKNLNALLGICTTKQIRSIYICLLFFTSEANKTRRIFAGANYFLPFFLHIVFNVFLSLLVKLNDNKDLLFIFKSIVSI